MAEAVSRFGDGRLEKDAPRPGRTPSISVAKVKPVIPKTTQEKPAHRTHLSTRRWRLPSASAKPVRCLWHKNGLKPHLMETFRVSDPHFAKKLEGASVFVSIHSSTPWRCVSVFLCFDEKVHFLRFVNDATPEHKQLHLIVDNYVTHKHRADVG